MGSEAHCRVDYGGQSAEAKVLLETEEIIVRGAMKLRIPFKEMERVAADGDALTFREGRAGERAAFRREVRDSCYKTLKYDSHPFHFGRKTGSETKFGVGKAVIKSPLR
jgi:hypothetical protein